MLIKKTLFHIIFLTSQYLSRIENYNNWPNQQSYFTTHTNELKGISDKNFQKILSAMMPSFFPTYPVSANIFCFTFFWRTLNVLNRGHQRTPKQKLPNKWNIDGLHIFDNGFFCWYFFPLSKEINCELYIHMNVLLLRFALITSNLREFVWITRKGSCMIERVYHLECQHWKLYS